MRNVGSFVVAGNHDGGLAEQGWVFSEVGERPCCGGRPGLSRGETYTFAKTPDERDVLKQNCLRLQPEQHSVRECGGQGIVESQLDIGQPCTRRRLSDLR